MRPYILKICNIPGNIIFPKYLNIPKCVCVTISRLVRSFNICFHGVCVFQRVMFVEGRFVIIVIVCVTLEWVVGLIVLSVCLIIPQIMIAIGELTRRSNIYISLNIYPVLSIKPSCRSMVVVMFICKINDDTIVSFLC